MGAKLLPRDRDTCMMQVLPGRHDLAQVQLFRRERNCPALAPHHMLLDFAKLKCTAFPGRMQEARCVTVISVNLDALENCTYCNRVLDIAKTVSAI